MTESRQLRVATYNIHKGILNDYFGLKRQPVIHELRERLHDLSADLVLLQEVQGRNERHASQFKQWPEEPQDEFLASAPHRRSVFQTAYGNNANYLHGHHGNALLSRYPILHQENRDVSDHALEKRGILHCVVLIGEVPVHCFVVHFGLFARSRKRQVDALIQWVRSTVPDDAPLLIGGDFNDWQNRLSSQLCQSLQVREAFDSFKPQYRNVHRAVHFVRDRLSTVGVDFEPPTWPTPRRVKSARTFPSLAPWLRMDRIYLRHFSVSDARVLRGPSWARMSDHSPLIVDLSLTAGTGA
ncbi:MAG: endonuclease/exonuclease/phosphatase family protein [Burkholderiaceae bacterium]